MTVVYKLTKDDLQQAVGEYLQQLGASLPETVRIRFGALGDDFWAEVSVDDVKGFSGGPYR